MTQRSRFTLIAVAGALLLPLCVSAAHAQSWQFTNCGVEGRLGPSQADCNIEYSGTPLAGAVTVAGGIQQWTVPATGEYLIEADGAAGGTQQYTGDEGDGAPSPGGLGASLQGTFNLTAGETLFIIVGQMGGDTQADTDTGDDWESAAPGGGGGTFVYRNANDALPLMAAGGGGSGSNCTAENADLQNASLLTAGNSAEGLNDGAGLVNGGAGGNGGTSNFDEEGSSYWAGGGAGWLTNGTGGFNPTDHDPAGVPNDGADGGLAPRNGATGGVRHNDGDDEDNTDEGGDGGFGGGGGGGSDNMGGGGGGGFSGGGGADGSNCLADQERDVSNNPGGGGGSFNGGNAPSVALAASRSHGQVTIRAASVTPAAPAIPVPSLSLWGLIVLMLSLGLFGMWGIRRS